MSTVQKLGLLILPTLLMGCSANDNAKHYLAQIDAVSPSQAFIMDFVATEREKHCHVPYTKSALEALKNDAMVIVATPLKTYVSEAEFPAYMTAFNATMNCDSYQWQEDMRAYVLHSTEFKTHIDELRHAVPIS
ncbi:putative lipoprotein (plasmid) [Aliivibrio wodanis]|uniref:Putative lipoprotein n=1 Tax=Aliivibrio wodanis TaxID=80852 RepID=A0A090K2J1_9GAMM|nr:putative lipoprotein [Aliivibrio wodanis]